MRGGLYAAWYSGHSLCWFISMQYSSHVKLISTSSSFFFSTFFSLYYLASFLLCPLLDSILKNLDLIEVLLTGDDWCYFFNFNLTFSSDLGLSSILDNFLGENELRILSEYLSIILDEIISILSMDCSLHTELFSLNTFSSISYMKSTLALISVCLIFGCLPSLAAVMMIELLE